MVMMVKFKIMNDFPVFFTASVTFISRQGKIL